MLFNEMLNAVHIGLLEAESLPNEVRQQYGSYGEMFERLLSPLNPNTQFTRYAVDLDQLPNHPNDCDAYIVTGSRFSAYDQEPWILRLQGFIREIERLKIPLLGICFGHQLIAQALGGRVVRSEAGWGIGVATFTAHPPLTIPSKNSFNVLVSHQDQVVKLPPNATLVASSLFCPIGGYVISDHILTFQGHPEFSTDYLSYLINKRKHKIGAERVANALKSLELTIDREALQRIIGNFLGIQPVIINY